jgi:hypothetical protein
MKRGSHDDLKRRDRDILLKYEEVIKGHGSLAKKIARSEFYERVAECFYITPQRAGVIINKMLKQKSVK